MGDQIAIAPTDYYPDQGERLNITAITPVANGNFQLGLATPLAFSHNGRRYTGTHKGNGKSYTLDARAEVAVLTRCGLNRWI